VSDRNGTPLSAGDSVLWYDDERPGPIEATVLVVGDIGYLIQIGRLNPPASAVEHMLNDVLEQALAHAGIDEQEPFVVAGDMLEKIIGDD
jgi:hypothetical protein